MWAGAAPDSGPLEFIAETCTLTVSSGPPVFLHPESPQGAPSRGCCMAEGLMAATAFVQERAEGKERRVNGLVRAPQVTHW